MTDAIDRKTTGMALLPRISRRNWWKPGRIVTIIHWQVVKRIKWQLHTTNNCFCIRHITQAQIVCMPVGAGQGSVHLIFFSVLVKTHILSIIKNVETVRPIQMPRSLNHRHGNRHANQYFDAAFILLSYYICITNKNTKWSNGYVSNCIHYTTLINLVSDGVNPCDSFVCRSSRRVTDNDTADTWPCDCSRISSTVGKMSKASSGWKRFQATIHSWNCQGTV